MWRSPEKSSASTLRGKVGVFYHMMRPMRQNTSADTEVYSFHLCQQAEVRVGSGSLVGLKQLMCEKATSHLLTLRIYLVFGSKWHNTHLYPSADKALLTSWAAVAQGSSCAHPLVYLSHAVEGRQASTFT